MTNWIKAANPLATTAGVDEARAAARMSSVALWLTAAKDVVLLVALLGSIPQASAATTSTGSNVATMTLAILGVSALVQIAAGLFQWVRPGTMIPIIAGMLTAYALYEAGMKMAGGASALAVISVVVMVLALILHIAGTRGAAALEKTQKPA